MPDFFDKYQLIKRIAHGGIAEVFLASQVGEVAGFTKQVAIKRMFPHLIERDDIISMFIDEARIVANLNHPAIVQTFDLGVIDGSFYIVMEYVDGLDLRKVCEIGIKNDVFLPAEIAVRIIIEAAAGLHYAHTRLDANDQPMGIVHRDISPQNILISRQGVVKVCDFGIAKAEHRLTTTRSGEFKGKFGYMSPEQAEGISLDWRSDIFSLGILLYEITAATRLFRAFNEYETIKMVINAEVQPPSQFIPNFPRDLESIILKALQRDPDHRYQTAEELQLALEDWLFSHRQRVGFSQIARYMDLLFTKIPDDSEDQQPAPTTSSISTTSAPKLRAPAAAPLTLPKPGRTSLSASHPDTGLRLALPKPRPISSIPTFSDDTVVIENQDEDLTRPLSISPSLIREAEAAYQLPSPGSLSKNSMQPQSLPEPRLAAPAQTVTPVPTPRPIRRNVPTPVLHSQNPRIEQPSIKPWSVESNENDDLDTDWARSHTRKKKLFAAIFSTLFVGFSAFAVWFLIQPDDPANNNQKLAESAIDEAAATYRGPLLDHPKANLYIDSIPPGAHIVVNGLLSPNKTPVDVALYDGVSNEVVLYSQGFLPHTIIVTPSNARTSQSVTLTPRPQPVAGKLQINSDPPGGSILLNGEALGTTPFSLDNIASNIEHHVQITLPNHHTFAGFIHVMTGIDNTIDARLAPLNQPSREVFVELAYDALPRGSQVFVDGEIRGVSPFYANHNRDLLLQIEFKANEHQAMNRTIATSEVGSFLIRPYLTPTKRELGHISLNIKPTPSNIYIGSNAYDQKQLRNIELLEGEYDAVFETADGVRIRTKIQVHPNQRTAYNVLLNDDQAQITTVRR